MKSIKSAVSVVGLATCMLAGYAQAASLQESLSSAASQLGQNPSSLGGLTGLLNGGNQALSAGNMNNAAGILQYCVKQKLVSATNTENIKNQLLDKLGLSAQPEEQQTDYTQGLAGLLKTRDGKQLNLNNIGNTPLAEKVKTKACDIVLKQGVKFLS